MDILKTWPNGANRELLLEQLSAQFPSITARPSGVEIHNVEAQDESAIDAILAAHVGSNLTEGQRIESAQVIALNQARDYLRKQYLQASPNPIAVAATIKTYVDNHPTLLQMVTIETASQRSAYSWPVLDLATPVGANRYLAVIKAILAILA